MSKTYTYSETNGNTKTDITYTAEPKAMQYTIIGDDIRKDFDFLTNSMQEKIGLIDKELRSAADNSSAFYFENGSSVNDLSKMYEEISEDLKQLNEGLNILHGALMKDIDNVNAELEYNFGHLAFYKVKEAGRTTTDLSNNNSSS